MRRIAVVSLCGSLAIGTATCTDGDVAGPDVTEKIPSPGLSGVIAFVSDRDGNPEIYTANADGSNVVRLTNDPAIDSDPVWSPDGKRIAFVSTRAAPQGASDVYVMNADGSNVVRRTTVGRSWSPAWSPNGRRIAFVAERNPASNSQIVYVMNVDANWQDPVRIGFSGSRNAITEGEPAWSPDGGKIAFRSSGDYTAGLFIANADGSGIRPLLKTSSEGDIKYVAYRQPAWSPDGSKIAVVECQTATGTCFPSSYIKLINGDGSGDRTLQATSGYPRPSWSPDGRTIAFSASSSAPICQINQVQPACKRSIRYVRTDINATGLIIEDGYSPAWRPDAGALPNSTTVNPPAGMVVSNPVADRVPSTSVGVPRANQVSASSFAGGDVAYVSAAPGSLPTAALVTVRNRTSGGAPIAAIVMDGGFDPVGVSAVVGDELLTTVAMKDGGATISMVTTVPPRRPPVVVRTQPAKGRTDVALSVQVVVVFSEPVNKATVNASSIRLLSNGVGVSGTVRASDDGLSAAFTPDGPLEQLTSYAIEVGQGVLDLDGDALAETSSSPFTTIAALEGVVAFVSDREGNPEIYTGNIDGTRVVRLTNNPGVDTDPAWSPDGKRIAFVSDRDGGSNIYVMNADGSNAVRRSIAGWISSSPAWSPDGRRIAYASRNPSSDIAGGQGGLFPLIYVMEVDGDWSRPAGVGPANAETEYPTWSPDGSRIAFASGYGLYDGEQIFSMKVDGTDIRVLAASYVDFTRYDEGEIYYQPAWSPDGNKIAVVACHFAPFNCYPFSTVSVGNADGTGLKTIQFAGSLSRPAWSPDSRFIAYGSASCWVCERSIRFVRADGTIDPRTRDTFIADAYS
ncbi:MAG: DPP IV N-terminal domain-containing protein, partial [Gemmatimonadales bacterium]